MNHPLGAAAVAKVVKCGKRAAMALTVDEIIAMTGLCIALVEKIRELDPDISGQIGEPNDQQ